MKHGWSDDYFKSQPPIVSGDLELRTFVMSVRCAPCPFPDSLKVEYSNIFYRAILKIIAETKIPKESLSFTSPEMALHMNKTQGEGTTGWFGIGYQEPGRSFGITVDDKVFQIRCDSIRLKELVTLADRVFSRITSAWVSDDLAKPVILEDRAHTVDYTFDFVFRLGKDKVQQKEVKNFDLLSEALSLERKPRGKGQKTVADAFSTIGIEDYIRLDYTQHATKKIEGHPFNVGIRLMAPFNEANSILNLTTFVRAEEEFSFDLRAALRWDIALKSFLRDIILKRFLDNLFCSISYTNM